LEPVSRVLGKHSEADGADRTPADLVSHGHADVILCLG
jgi:hypothetical protein